MDAATPNIVPAVRSGMNVSCCASSRFDAGARKGELLQNKPQAERGEFPLPSLRDWAPWLRKRSEKERAFSLSQAHGKGMTNCERNCWQAARNEHGGLCDRYRRSFRSFAW